MEKQEIIILKRRKEVLRTKNLSKNTVIISKGCKTLVIKGGCFQKIQISGDFEKIIFEGCRGEIYDSKFSCKEIHLIKADRDIIDFQHSSINGLEKIISNGGFIYYENPDEELFCEKNILIVNGGFELETSDCICSSIKLINSMLDFSSFKSHFDYAENYYNKKVNILCDEFIIEGNVTWIDCSLFYINGICFHNITKSLFKDDFDKMEVVEKLLKTLNIIFNSRYNKALKEKDDEVIKVQKKYDSLIATKKISDY